MENEDRSPLRVSKKKKTRKQFGNFLFAGNNNNPRNRRSNETAAEMWKLITDGSPVRTDFETAITDFVTVRSGSRGPYLVPEHNFRVYAENARLIISYYLYDGISRRV